MCGVGACVCVRVCVCVCVLRARSVSEGTACNCCVPSVLASRPEQRVSPALNFFHIHNKNLIHNLHKPLELNTLTYNFDWRRCPEAALVVT